MLTEGTCASWRQRPVRSWKHSLSLCSAEWQCPRWLWLCGPGLQWENDRSIAPGDQGGALLQAECLCPLKMHCDDIWRCGLWDVIKLIHVHEGFVGLKEKTPENLFSWMLSCHGKDTLKSWPLKAKKRALSSHQICWPLDLGLPSLQNCQK